MSTFRGLFFLFIVTIYPFSLQAEEVIFQADPIKGELHLPPEFDLQEIRAYLECKFAHINNGRIRVPLDVTDTTNSGPNYVDNVVKYSIEIEGGQTWPLQLKNLDSCCYHLTVDVNDLKQTYSETFVLAGDTKRMDSKILRRMLEDSELSDIIMVQLNPLRLRISSGKLIKVGNRSGGAASTPDTLRLNQ